MREIKFRAWDGSKMYTFDNHAFDLIYNDISGWNVSPNLPCEQLRGVKWTTGESSDSAKHFQLMQFTGLKDKNGKEIYEGDIIQFKVDFPDQEFDNGVVRWADGGYWTSQTEDDLEELLSGELSDLPGEVIGNIYETPELVTPK